MKQDRRGQKVIAVVPIRAGSKGLPGKNMKHLLGKPLYLHAVEQGLRIAEQVFVTTDIDEIKSDQLPAGCMLRRREAALAADNTPMSEVLLDLIRSKKLQDCTIVLLQATSPLRSDEDIERSKALFDEGCHDLVMSVVKRDQSVLKYGTLQDKEFVALRDADYCFQNRQQLPSVYSPNGAVYVFNSDTFLVSGGFPSERIGAIEMNEERSHDIDTLADFLTVEKSMKDSL